MELGEEIKAAARQLGQALRQDDYIRTYIDALKAAQIDPDASALEKKMYDEYKALIARQQVGEGFNQEETRAFFELHQEAQNHPLISKRHDKLRLVKPYLAQIAEEISCVLDVDYAALAKPQ